MIFYRLLKDIQNCVIKVYLFTNFRIYKHGAELLELDKLELIFYAVLIIQFQLSVEEFEKENTSEYILIFDISWYQY